MVLDIYAQTWEQEEAAAKEKEPDLEAWQKSGVKKTEKDLQDRFIRGRDQIAAYMENTRKERLRPWTLPDTGRVASEVEFEESFGDVIVRGSVDLILEDPDTGALLIRDIKTGSKKPVGHMQLAVYRHAIRKKYGVDPLWGDYWMCKDGGPTPAAPLWPYSEQLITAQFEALDQAVRDELYLANIGDHCTRCGVAAHCPFVGGQPPEGIALLGT